MHEQKKRLYTRPAIVGPHSSFARKLRGLHGLHYFIKIQFGIATHHILLWHNRHFCATLRIPTAQRGRCHVRTQLLIEFETVTFGFAFSR